MHCESWGVRWNKYHALGRPRVSQLPLLSWNGSTDLLLVFVRVIRVRLAHDNVDFAAVVAGP
jgi:hypothetical protein